MILREYQAQAISSIKSEFLSGHKKCLLWLATGSGKTVIFCKMVKDAVAKNKRAIILVRGRKLVDQASQRLFREHVPHGILMAGSWNFRPHLPVQVCSIDTLISRKLRPEADLIIIDEAHLATSKGYKEFLSQYHNAFVVAVTATPYCESGLTHVADSVVHPVTMEDLINQGHLVPFKYYAPTAPDLSDVKVSSSTHDYVVDQLEGAMVKGQLTGKIIEHWKLLGENRPTICFAVNVHHSQILVDKFKDAGIAAEHCDANTPDSEREEIIKRLESGETKVICNVGIMGTGVDIPCLGAIIMARPTKSLNLYIQQCGRGTRPFPGKTNCIILDHAGNIEAHDLPTDESPVSLVGVEKREAHVKQTKTCKICFACYRGEVCPECGTVPPPTPKINIEESEDKLEELNPVYYAQKRLLKEAKAKGLKKAWTYYKLIDRFGFEAAKPFLPDWFIERYEQNKSNLFSHSPFQGFKRD